MEAKLTYIKLNSQTPCLPRGAVPIIPIARSAATIAYGYDELGRVTSRSVDGSTTDANNVSTSFDSLGRVTGVTNALGAFTYAYVDQTSRLSSVTYPTGTGLSTSYAYFNNVGDQRLQTIQNMTGTTQLSRFDYTYNPVGTIATWTQQAYWVGGGEFTTSPGCPSNFEMTGATPGLALIMAASSDVSKLLI